MAYNKIELFKKQNQGEFLVSKTSALQIFPSASGYYVQRKHIRSGISLSDRFISSFNSQINPTILPGSFGDVEGELPIETSYILSELSEPLLSEDNNNLIIE